jgi:hypothetical protein
MVKLYVGPRNDYSNVKSYGMKKGESWPATQKWFMIVSKESELRNSVFQKCNRQSIIEM